MKRLYLSCVKNGIECSYGEHGSQKFEEKKIIKTKEQLKTFLSGKNIDITLCSSSMDFPNEYTKDKTVISLCDWIRSE